MKCTFWRQYNLEIFFGRYRPKLYIESEILWTDSSYSMPFSKVVGPLQPYCAVCLCLLLLYLTFVSITLISLLFWSLCWQMWSYEVVATLVQTQNHTFGTYRFTGYCQFYNSGNWNILNKKVVSLMWSKFSWIYK